MLTGVGKLPLVPILPPLVTGPVPPPVFPCDLGGQQNGRGKGRGRGRGCRGSWRDLQWPPLKMMEQTDSQGSPGHPTLAGTGH